MANFACKEKSVSFILFHPLSANAISPLTYTERVAVSGALLDSASIQIWQNPIFCWERSTAPLCGQEKVKQWC